MNKPIHNSFSKWKEIVIVVENPVHKSPDCRTKENTSKDEWAINKAQKTRTVKEL